MPTYLTLRAMIWGKTYPEISKRHTETVCTGAVLEDGRPIRLYPVPLRYLEGDQQYSIGDIVVCKAEKSTSDPRPESYRIDAASLRVDGNVGTDRQEWAERRKWIFRDTSWHYEGFADLEAARRASNASMGVIKPGSIERVYLYDKPESERLQHEEKAAAVAAQGDLFIAEYKNLEYLPRSVRLEWRCAKPCAVCTVKPHDYMVLDWGLLELARRADWDGAKAKLESIANLATHDFRMFVGNYKLHPQHFGVIGLWYPKLREQGVLL